MSYVFTRATTNIDSLAEELESIACSTSWQQNSYRMFNVHKLASTFAIMNASTDLAVFTNVEQCELSELFTFQDDSFGFLTEFETAREGNSEKHRRSGGIADVLNCIQGKKKKSQEGVVQAGVDRDGLSVFLRSIGIMNEVYVIVKNPHINLCSIAMQHVHVTNIPSDDDGNGGDEFEPFAKRVLYKGESIMYLLDKFQSAGLDYAVKQLVFDSNGYVYAVVLSKMQQARCFAKGVIDWHLMSRDKPLYGLDSYKNLYHHHWYSKHVFYFN